MWFLPSALNVKVKKFNQARVNGGSNYDSLTFTTIRRKSYPTGNSKERIGIVKTPFTLIPPAFGKSAEGWSTITTTWKKISPSLSNWFPPIAPLLRIVYHCVYMSLCSLSFFLYQLNSGFLSWERWRRGFAQSFWPCNAWDYSEGWKYMPSGHNETNTHTFKGIDGIRLPLS